MGGMNQVSIPCLWSMYQGFGNFPAEDFHHIFGRSISNIAIPLTRKYHIYFQDNNTPENKFKLLEVLASYMQFLKDSSDYFGNDDYSNFCKVMKEKKCESDLDVIVEKLREMKGNLNEF